MIDMDPEPRLLENFANMTGPRVDKTFGPPLEDEAIEVEHLLAEPKSDNISVDGVLCFGKDNLGKCFEMEEFSCGFEYGFTTNYGGLESNNTQEGEYDLRLEARAHLLLGLCPSFSLLHLVLDGLLDDVDELDDIHAAHDLSTACEDFLLDIEFAEEVSELDCGLCEKSNLGNSSSESHSPGFSRSSNGATGIAESPTETVPESQWKNDSPDKRVSCDIHQSFRSKCGCQAPVEDSMGPTSKDVQNLYELDDDEKPLVSFILSNKKGKNPVRAGKLGTYLGQKRLRKPTRRYIEEFSDLKSRYLMSGEKVSTSAAKDNFLKVRAHDKLHHTEALKLVSGQESFSGTSSQPPSESRVRRGCPKKSPRGLDLESDDEHIESESEDDRLTAKRSKGGDDHRKHQRMWTLTEVMKLIDGISQYGVGRWTDIKKLLFSSSAYRTPIDLRDKWRNLLRASCAHKHNQKHNRREAEEKLKHAMRPLPKHVLCRIRELAAIHPYPRKSNSKISSPTLPTTTKGAPFSPHGRNLRRKNCT